MMVNHVLQLELVLIMEVKSLFLIIAIVNTGCQHVQLIQEVQHAKLKHVLIMDHLLLLSLIITAKIGILIAL